MAVAVLGDREPFGVVLLAVVVDQTDQPVTAIGAQAAEHAADIDRTVLVGITDQADRPTRTTDVVGEAGEVAGAEHRRLIDHDDRPGRQAAGRAPVAQIPAAAGRPCRAWAPVERANPAARSSSAAAVADTAQPRIGTPASTWAATTASSA